MILSYPGLFKNIPHVWFLRLYSLIKNPQYDFPKMRGGGSKAVRNFSENSSILGELPFPKSDKYELGALGGVGLAECVTLGGDTSPEYLILLP